MQRHRRGFSMIQIADRAFRTALLSVTLIAALGARAGAQVAAETSAARRRLPVTIALVDSLPDSTVGAVILRRGNQSDAILMTRNSANARQLSAALATLISAWHFTGKNANRDATIRVESRDGPAAWENTELVRAEQAIRNLRRRPVRHLPGIGNGQALVLLIRPFEVRTSNPLPSQSRK
jgi:hypothetical protein